MIFWVGLFLSFALGGYIWRFSNRMQTKSDFADGSDSDRKKLQPVPMRGTIVTVAEKPVTAEDLQFEYDLHTAGLSNAEELTQIPNLGSRFAKDMEPLKQLLLATLLERKILYHYIAQETDFDINNPGRFVECLKEWQTAVEQQEEFKMNEASKVRLKSRICESSIVKQFLSERVYPKVSPTDQEIKAYYEKHLERFKRPDRIVIRQILFATEEEANKVRPQINRGNFAALAKQYSIAPEAEKGGQLGPFARGEMPSVFDVAFELREGEIRGVLKSSYGFHVFMLEEKIKKQELSIKQATAQIISTLESERKDAAYQKLIETALNTVEIKQPKPLW
jgi:peptidyl-prolyl cis-trans isomerase C